MINDLNLRQSHHAYLCEHLQFQLLTMSDAGRTGPQDAGPSRLRDLQTHQTIPFPLVPKVSQIDAENLDESLVGLLSEKVETALGNFSVGLYRLCI